MNPYNQRKEPTFGEPSALASDKIETVEQNANETAIVQPTKLPFSLHTNTSPGHTFTPVMKHASNNAKHLSTLEEKAEQTMSNQQTPKAPNGGFSFTPVQEPQSPTAEHATAVESTPVEPEKTEEQEEQVVQTASPIERVIPVAAAPVAKAVEKVPSKYRRLLIVLLLLLALLLAFFLLKPKTPDTVENLQQGSSLPIEFRPVDEEEAKRAEAQAKALQEAQAAQQAQQHAEQTAQTTANTQTEQGTQPAVNNENTAVSAPQTQTTETAPVAPVQEPQAVAVKPVQVAVQPKPVVQEPAQKPTSSGSVIYQPETATKAPAPQPKVESKPPVKVETAKPAVTQPKAAPVVVAEPAKVATAVSSKTMTVPKGVSLMQVFRDNNLNISDVNAMSKVNNIVSHLKVGEKVTVRLDKDNRVTEMSIGSGGKFIRQANGTYIYK